MLIWKHSREFIIDKQSPIKRKPLVVVLPNPIHPIMMVKVIKFRKGVISKFHKKEKEGQENILLFGLKLCGNCYSIKPLLFEACFDADLTRDSEQSHFTRRIQIYRIQTPRKAIKNKNAKVKNKSTTLSGLGL